MNIRITVSGKTVWQVVLHAAAAITVVWLLWRSVTPIAWAAAALLVAMALDPAVSWGVRRGVPRIVSVVVIVGSIVGLVVGLAARVGPDLVDQARKLILDLPAALERLRDHRVVIEAEERFGLVTALQNSLREQAARVPIPLIGAAWKLLTTLGGVFAVLMLTAFMLMFGREALASVLQWLPAEDRDRWRGLAVRIRIRVGGYMVGVVLIALVSGLVMSGTLLLVGVPYVLPLGLSVAFCGLIPFIGFIVSGLLVVITTFVTVGVQAGLVVGLVYLVYQPVEHHVLQPLIQRHTIHLSPLVIAFSALLGTFAVGVWGAVLALPVAGVLQLLLEDVRRTHALTVEQPKLASESVDRAEAAPSGPPTDAPTGGA